MDFDQTQIINDKIEDQHFAFTFKDSGIVEILSSN